MLSCYVCDQDIDKDTVPLSLFGEPIHPRCDIPDEFDVCDNDKCHWWRCEHSGLCVT